MQVYGMYYYEDADYLKFCLSHVVAAMWFNIVMRWIVSRKLADIVS